jgi:hypothetical protein
MHFSAKAHLAMPSSSSINTSLGQKATQMPQPLHHSRSMRISFFGLSIGFIDLSRNDRVGERFKKFQQTGPSTK